jgi:bifunctional non-homologous end joining protein LigD
LGEGFPLIVRAALKLRRKHFVINGEVVVPDRDGVSDFDALASRQHDKWAQLYAFDMLASNGEDLHALPLALRKSKLARLLSRPLDGIFIAEYEQGGVKISTPEYAKQGLDIGDALFRVACNMGLGGIVSKRLDRAYRPGKCAHWVKIKNPKHPAHSRVRDQLLQSPPLRSRRSA